MIFSSDSSDEEEFDQKENIKQGKNTEPVLPSSMPVDILLSDIPSAK